MEYKIENRILGGWADAGWEENDKPLRFATYRAGQVAIDEFCKTSGHAVAEYRVVSVHVGLTRKETTKEVWNIS